MDTEATRRRRIEIQRELYEARNAYLKARREVEHYQRRIAFLKQAERDLNRPEILDELYSSLAS